MIVIHALNCKAVRMNCNWQSSNRIRVFTRKQEYLVLIPMILTFNRYFIDLLSISIGFQNCVPFFNI